MSTEIPNRYAGKCVVCDKSVDVGAGFAFKTESLGKWKVRHPSCKISAAGVPEAPKYVVGLRVASSDECPNCKNKTSLRNVLDGDIGEPLPVGYVPWKCGRCSTVWVENTLVPEPTTPPASAPSGLPTPGYRRARPVAPPARVPAKPPETPSMYVTMGDTQKGAELYDLARARGWTNIELRTWKEGLNNVFSLRMHDPLDVVRLWACDVPEDIIEHGDREKLQELLYGTFREARVAIMMWVRPEGSSVDA